MATRMHDMMNGYNCNDLSNLYVAQSVSMFSGALTVEE